MWSWKTTSFECSRAREEHRAILPVGFGVDGFLVGLLSQECDNPFKDVVPGKHWWKGFLGRFQRERENFPPNRSLASSADVMDHFFQ